MFWSIYIFQWWTRRWLESRFHCLQKFKSQLLRKISYSLTTTFETKFPGYVLSLNELKAFNTVVLRLKIKSIDHRTLVYRTSNASREIQSKFFNPKNKTAVNLVSCDNFIKRKHISIGNLLNNKKMLKWILKYEHYSQPNDFAWLGDASMFSMDLITWLTSLIMVIEPSIKVLFIKYVYI